MTHTRLSSLRVHTSGNGGNVHDYSVALPGMPRATAPRAAVSEDCQGTHCTPQRADSLDRSVHSTGTRTMTGEAFWRRRAGDLQDQLSELKGHLAYLLEQVDALIDRATGDENQIQSLTRRVQEAEHLVSVLKGQRDDLNKRLAQVMTERTRAANAWPWSRLLTEVSSEKQGNVCVPEPSEMTIELSTDDDC